LVITSPNASIPLVRVFDVSGRLLIESKPVNGQINLKNLAPGLYNVLVDNYNCHLIKK
jgi:hypothetical protein